MLSPCGRIDFFRESSLQGRSEEWLNKEEYNNHMAQQNLFIGRLAFATTDEGLKEYFGQIGEVEEARIITDPHNNNRSKGFGFVSYVNADDNQKAIDKLDGSELDGRTISVSLARPKTDRPRREFNGQGGGDRGNSGGAFRQRSW